MAKAIIHTEKIPVTSYREEHTVNLSLSLEEAIMLLSVTQAIGGHPDTTSRGLTDGIGGALETAKVPQITVDFKNSIKATKEHFEDIKSAALLIRQRGY